MVGAGSALLGYDNASVSLSYALGGGILGVKSPSHRHACNV